MFPHTPLPTFVCSILLYGCFAMSCGPAASSSADVSVKPTPPLAPAAPVLKVDSMYQTIGSLLAGTMEDDKIKALFPGQASFLIDHRNVTAEKFSGIERERLFPMKGWNAGLMAEHKITEDRFVFYPFSGADLVHVHALFPKAKSYLMVAMEPVGEIPDLTQEDTSLVREYVQSIDFILRDIYQKSYFITKNMISDFGDRSKVNGVAPILLWTLSRLGYKIASVRFYTIDSSGMKQPALAGTSIGRGLVEIDFFQPGDQSVRSLSYLSCDASDEGFSARPEYRKFLEASLPAVTNTFVKSASYLMHYGSFSAIRSITLEHSGYLIQDDTGIPYAFLIDRGFQVRLFGAYEKPVRDFSSNLFQKDLDEAYRDSSQYAGKLNFSLGYHWWGDRKQNQLVAIRRTAKE